MNYTISDIYKDQDTLKFTLQGTYEDGLDKSIANGLRRIISSEIPSVAFRTDEGTKLDIKIDINNSSLHNEFLMERMSLLPLYINPEDYNRDLLFTLQVRHDNKEPFKFITSDMIKIYPVKDNADLDLDKLSIDNYNLEKPLSNSEKKKIIRPFIYQNKEFYHLLHELKNTYAEDTIQEISLYGVPSVSIAKEHARWKSVSDIVYTFTINEEQFIQVANEKADLENIPDEKRDNFIKSLRLSESERYYFRDINSEPYSYDFTITSQHILSSKVIFMQSCVILQKKLKNLQENLVTYLKNKETTILIKHHNQSSSIYDIYVTNEDDTLGNILQTHIANLYIDENSIINACGYKKSHPLEDFIVFTVSINPENDIFNKNDDQKLISIIRVFESAINDLFDIVNKIMDVANKSL